MKQKTLINKIIEYFKEKYKIRMKEKKSFEKIYQDLSLQELESYHSLLKNSQKFSNPTYWLIAPFKIMLWLGIFGLVMLHAFNINILDNLLIFSKSILGLYPIFIFLFIFELIYILLPNNKLKRTLLTKIDKK